MRRVNAILKRAAPIMRRAALLNEAGAKRHLRGQALLKLVGVAPRIPIPFHNKKGRQFFLTLKGSYVVRDNGKSLYGRKACVTGKNLSSVPAKIRPKRVKK